MYIFDIYVYRVRVVCTGVKANPNRYAHQLIHNSIMGGSGLPRASHRDGRKRGARLYSHRSIRSWG